MTESIFQRPTTRHLGSLYRSVAVLTAIVLAGCSNKEPNSATDPQTDKQVEGTSNSQELRVLGSLPDFTFTDQSKSELSLDDLRGRVWIGNFIFTRCLATCPQQTAKLVYLQEKLKDHPACDDVRFVSFSVDPEFDTPEVLADYAQKHQADPECWKFLTGPREAIWELSKEGFKLPVGNAPENPAMPIFHSPQFILVDRTSQIRGYYDSGDERTLVKLRKDLNRLLKEP